ncbi:MAG: hypothetical protein AB1898_18550 [Acidobacteriota bacterium]
MRTRTFTLLAASLIVSGLILGGVSHAADNQVGVWKLNVAKSKYSPGPPPKEGRLTIEALPNGLKITVHGTAADGKTVHFEMSPKFDGKDYPMTGNPDADMISIKKIDEYTIETVGKKGGAPTMTVRSVVSKDGKTRTTTQKGTNARGQAVDNILIYDRQ